MSQQTLPKKRSEIRGSNSGFVKNSEVYTSDASGCLRTILVRDLKLPEEEPGTSFANVIYIGAQNEARFAYLNPDLMREVELTEEINADVAFSGHADFVGSEKVYETKSVTSKRVHATIFKKGEFKLANLAQLVRYMLVAGKTSGELVYTSYNDVIDYSELSFLKQEELFPRLEKSAAETRVFQVEFAQDGAVLVDKKVTGFTVQDSWEHLVSAAEYLASKTSLPPRPVVTSAVNPCFFCPLKAVCDSSPVSKQEFLDLATATLTKDFNNE